MGSEGVGYWRGGMCMGALSEGSGRVGCMGEGGRHRGTDREFCVFVIIDFKRGQSMTILG